MIGRYAPIGSRIGRAEVVGWELTKQGKRKAKTDYREYIQTAEGNIEMSKWIEKALEEVEQMGMKDLYDRVKEHCRQLRWLKTEKELNDWALHCLYYESYLHWPDFTIIWA